ncbi:hypothetical protein C8R47DRAFT_1148997 [Mycena vitilis]|nr:hypothetical protein C8R47DRAFT_1148997 [Mycena vitilis]
MYLSLVTHFWGDILGLFALAEMWTLAPGYDGLHLTSLCCAISGTEDTRRMATLRWHGDYGGTATKVAHDLAPLLCKRRSY